MTAVPVPFRLSVPARESIGFGGVKSVSYKVHGLLHVTPTLLTLEWSGTQTTEQLTFEKIGTDVDELPVEWLELPMDEVASARLLGSWFWPRLELRARLLDSFDGVPTVRGATLRLKVARRDRAVAWQAVREIQRYINAPALPSHDQFHLED